MRYFTEREVEYVMDMMKNRYKDFKKSDMVRPFFIKAMQTLEVLCAEMGIEGLYQKVHQQFNNDVNIENTFRLLIRAKLIFSARSLILTILTHITTHELTLTSLLDMIERLFD